MIKSMTGYGYFERIDAEQKITVEMKSVNHRYFDLNIRMPKKFNAFEREIRSIVKTFAERGKIDLYINYESYVDNKITISYHEDVAREYADAVKKAGDSFSLEKGLSAADLLHYPEVITIEEKELDAGVVYESLADAIKEAAGRFLETKQAEGRQLQEDIEKKLEHILELVESIEERSPEIVKEYRNRILEKVKELLGDRKIDDAVLAAEITIFADKICVDEETVRLKSHVNSMLGALKEEESVGRKLDFIAQEMNREANTILSKANDRAVSDYAIGLKTEIEKIREQIQNIE